MFNRLVAAVLIFFALATPSRAQSSNDSVRLVVMVVIDQFRGDYLKGYEPHFVDGGFRRLMSNGASMTHARFQYGCTATGPGHATLATGAYPAEHGIVANNWILPKEASRPMYCCGDSDDRYSGLPKSPAAPSRSPKQLLVDTLGDRMKAKFGAACQVWGIALKDRAAILTAGHQADGAIWWHSASGDFVSSTYYSRELPTWVQKFNEEHFVDRFFGKTWDRLLPEEAYPTRFLNGGNDSDWRKYNRGEFPKVIGQGQTEPNRAYYAQLYASPFGNELVFELARRATVAQKLGQDDKPDLLTICLGSNDVVGHSYGPDSNEVMDCSLRTDRQLATFLDWLDQTVGLDRCIVALSSDHGVGPMSEYAKAVGQGGGRVKQKRIKEKLESNLVAKFGRATGQKGYIRDVGLPWVYLNEDTINAGSNSLQEVARVVRNAVLNQDGMAAAFDFTQIQSPGFSAKSDLHRQVRNSYHPDRCGHVYVHLKRYWSKGRKVGVHGAAHDYDQHVPVMIMGKGIKPGTYDAPVCPTGMVHTIYHLLGINDPQDVGTRKYDMILNGN
ncbi:MAG: alkaline phosphatase family protein [Planctomycetes bacterium]|nr:alkaline phosphatase family protein [Planctomycetota bacterium]